MRGFYSYTTLFFIVGSLFIDINSYGQGRPGTLANGLIPDVTPPSSEAAGLAKYGDYDVSYYTGLPQINIPIYTINAGSLSVPIGISYHGAGVKVDDVESWVGVNWSLNAGGMISRTVVGLPDENLYGFLYQNRNGFPLAASYNCALKEDYVFFRKIIAGDIDTEPDLFYFNFGQYSGKFFFDENGKFQSIPANALKLIRCPLNYTEKYVAVGGYWEIADPSGNRYQFGSSSSEAVEKSRVSGAPALPPNQITAWYLKKIISFNGGDTVTFNYTDKLERYDLPYNQSIRQLDGTPGSTVVGDLKVNTVLYNGDHPGLGDPSIFNVIGKSQLSEIVWKEGKIAVAADRERTDMFGKILTNIKLFDNTNKKIKGFDFKYVYTGSRYYLDTLIESGTNDNKQLKHIFEYFNRGSLPVRLTQVGSPRSFAQDHWGYYNGQNGNNDLIPMVDYYIRTTTTSRKPDEASMKCGSLKRIYYPTGGYTDFEFEANTFKPGTVPGGASYEITGKSTSVGAKNPQPGTLQRVEIIQIPFSQNNASISIQFKNYAKPPSADAGWLPTVSLERKDGSTWTEVRDWDAFNNFPSPAPTPNANGLIDFNIELPSLYLTAGEWRITTDLVCGQPSCGTPAIYPSVNAQISYYVYDTEGGDPNVGMIGGLRIKNIINYSHLNTVSSKRTFTYSAGRALAYPRYFNKYSEDVFGLSTCVQDPSCSSQNPCTVYEQKFYELTSNSQTILGFTQGSAVGYDSVTEMMIDPTGVANGKTLYTYSFAADQLNAMVASSSWPHTILNPAMPSDNYEYKRGLLLTKKVYARATDGSFIIQQSQENSYSYNDNVPANRFKKFRAMRVKRFRMIEYRCGEYYQNYFWPTTSSTETDFGYTMYNLVTSWPQLTSTVEKTYAPNGIDFQTTTTSYEYNNAVHLQPTAVTLNNSKQQSIKTVSKYPHDFAGTAVYDSMIVRNNITPVIERIEFQNVTQENSRNKINYGFWNGIKTIAPINEHASLNGSTLFKTINYDNYDSNGNLIQYTGADGVVTSLVMGYKYGKLVAKVTGANYSAVTGKINITTLQDLTGAALRTELAKLRTIPGAQTSSFTFDLLTGPSSYTDLRGRNQYYEYDELQRPMVVRDHDNKIIKKFAYNYHGQTPSDNVYYNTTKSNIFQKTGCASCMYGSLVTYTVPANKYSSTISSTLPNDQAQAEMDNNGQAFANATGTCSSTPATAYITLSNVAPVLIVFQNTCTNVTYNRPMTSANSDWPLSGIPEGNYNITFSTAGSTTYTFKIITPTNIHMASSMTGTSFSNVILRAVGNTISVY